jgi:pSer/pThr/pTyr-binding forkhead associated (FHA) protein
VKKSKNGFYLKKSSLFLIIRDYKIGRNPEKTDITIQDLTVSRVHAQISVSENYKFYLKDLGSGNYYLTIQRMGFILRENK